MQYKMNQWRTQTIFRVVAAELMKIYWVHLIEVNKLIKMLQLFTSTSIELTNGN